MATYHIPRIVIAGTSSGVGKTTIVAGLLAAYKEKGKTVQSYKVGPDYIDPGFHRMASGRESYNLDSWLVPAKKMEPFFAETAKDADLAIIEGVMGLYDGGMKGISSTAEIAKRLKAPVILVINAKSMGESAAAIAKGFKDYDPDVHIAAVLLNRLGSDNHENIIKQALEKLGIPVVGGVRRDDQLSTPERHLGLTPVTETNPEEMLRVIKEAMKTQVNLDYLEMLAESAPDLEVEIEAEGETQKRAKLGVALDEAFSFYYPASLSALEKAGAELVYFSPLHDKELPDVDGLILGGGFPEMFLSFLQRNKEMRMQIKTAGEKGMPIYAECGGLMYLCNSISSFDKQEYEMVGLVPQNCEMKSQLQRVGYVTAHAISDNILVQAGEELRGHEFHFSTVTPTMKAEDFPWAFSMQGARNTSSHLGGYINTGGKRNILASYLHINFAGNEGAAKRFIDFCEAYSKNK